MAFGDDALTAITGLLTRMGELKIRKAFSWTGYKKPMPKWTYFTDQEVIGLDPELVAKLDMARKTAGVPFVLTSTTGGVHVKNSAHYKGLAVDLGLGQFADGYTRDHAAYLMMNGLYDAGFRRIGIYPAHIHVDIGQQPDYPQGVLWQGKDGG